LGSGIGDYFNWDRTVDGQTSACFEGSAACPTVAYVTTVQVNSAIDWIDSQTGPWFAWFSFNAPHRPFHIPPHELVSPATLARLPTDGIGQTLPPGTECSGADRRPCYLAMVEAADAELARLLDLVPADTTIILLGDNGTPSATTELPFISDRAKGSVYEGGVNVPMIIRDPDGTSQGSESAALIHIVDLFATVIELAGGTVPADRPLDSLSLVPLIADPGLPLRTTNYAENDGGQAMRDDRFKLIRGQSSEELYDLEGAPPAVPGDPFEQDDLLQGTLTSEQQAALDNLRSEMDDLLGGGGGGPGSIPDGGNVPGTPLTAAKATAGQITLSWGASCVVSDGDYGVYEGALGDFTSHAPVLCSSGGSHFATFLPQAGNTYYLVVPNDGSLEGSYGFTSESTARGQGASACLTKSFGGCP
jgi:hypothetical protein